MWKGSCRNWALQEQSTSLHSKCFHCCYFTFVPLSERWDSKKLSFYTLLYYICTHACACFPACLTQYLNILFHVSSPAILCTFWKLLNMTVFKGGGGSSKEWTSSILVALKRRRSLLFSTQYSPSCHLLSFFRITRENWSVHVWIIRWLFKPTDSKCSF
jgi:hypothetical protein